MASSTIKYTNVKGKQRRITATSTAEGIRLLHSAIRSEYGDNFVVETGEVVIVGASTHGYIATNTNVQATVFVNAGGWLFSTKDGTNVYMFTGTLQ